MNGLHSRVDTRMCNCSDQLRDMFQLDDSHLIQALDKGVLKKNRMFYFNIVSNLRSEKLTLPDSVDLLKLSKFFVMTNGSHP